MKNIISFMFLLFGLSITTHSQIFYQDIDPDHTISSWDSKDIHIDSSVTSILSYGASGNLTIWQEFNSRIAVNAFSDCDVLMDGTYPAALDQDQLIDSSGTWQEPDYAILNDGTNGHWKGVTDKYIGVRIKSGINWLYGWIRMDVNLAGNSVTIKDYACNRTINGSIFAGQTIDTSTAILNPYNSEVNPISIYPNPFNLWAIIKSDKKWDRASVTIYSLLGKEIKTIPHITSWESKIYRNDLPNGVYLIRVKQGNKISSNKIVISDK